MKIGIIARTWFTETKGGTERYISKLLEELRKHVEVNAITLDISTDQDVTQIKIPKISLITQVFYSFFTSKILNKVKPDVCLINQYWAEFSPLLLKVPWIPIIHDVGLFYSEWAKKHRVKHIIRTQVLKKVTKKAKIIIVPSKLTAKDLQTYLNVPEYKIKIIPEGIDLTTFKPLSVTHHGINIVCVGRIAPNKGQELLIRAFKLINLKHPNSYLYLVGGVSKYQKTYYNKLKETIERDKIKNVVITGYVTDKELIKYYQMTDIYIQPSIGEEGWGITIVEAFACKKPVICTNIFYETGVADIDRALIVNSSPIELAEAIELLIDNKPLKNQLAEEGYQFAQNLSWKKMTNEVLSVIDTLFSINNVNQPIVPSHRP